MTTDHQQLAERFLAMLNQHDPDAVEGFVAARYINHNPFVADREANRAFWASFYTAFPDLTATMDDLIQARDRMAGPSPTEPPPRAVLRHSPCRPAIGCGRSTSGGFTTASSPTLGRTQPARGVPAASRHPRTRPGHPEATHDRPRPAAHRRGPGSHRRHLRHRRLRGDRARAALAHVDDRTLTGTTGYMHDYADRRLPVPGAIGLAATVGTAVAAWPGTPAPPSPAARQCSPWRLAAFTAASAPPSTASSAPPPRRTHPG